MKVGIVIDDLDRRRGGMSEWCWQFVSTAANRGCDLHVIAQGFGVEPLPLRVARHRIDRTKSRVAFSESVARLVPTLGLDVVHDMGIGTNFDILQPHGGSFDVWLSRRLDYYPRWLRALKRPIDALLPRHRDFARHWHAQCDVIRRSDSTVIALSNRVADDLSRASGIRPEQITVIPNGVDCKRFTPVHRATHREATRRQLGVNGCTVLLLLAAHNLRLKGAPELLRLASKLVANKRRVHVAIVGGRHLEQWKLAAHRLGIANRVSFVGTVTDMTPYYAAADAYVHPTYYDPCSLVLLEAAASALPIVTTRRFNGAVELFREDDEILTVDDPTAEEAMYERVEALFSERLRDKLGAAARRVALRNPIEGNIATIMRLYDSRTRGSVAA